MRRLVVLVVVLTGLAVAAPAHASTTGDVSGRPTPLLTDLVLGSDGALWSLASDARQVVRFVPGQPDSLATFPLPGGYGTPVTLAASPDGDLFYGTLNYRLLRIDIDTHTVTPVGDAPGGRELAFGADGRLWVTSYLSPSVWAIDVSDDDVTDDDITEIELPGRLSLPVGLIAGQDGHLWFIASDEGRLARIDPGTEAMTSFALPGLLQEDRPFVDDTGVVWVTRNSSIASFDPATRTFRAFPKPSLGSYNGSWLQVSGPMGGPDGEIWLLGDGVMARLHRSTGDFDVYALNPISAYGGRSVFATDAHGQLWAAYGNRLLRVEDHPSADTTDPVVTVSRPTRGAHYLTTATVRARLSCRAPGGGRVVDCVGNWVPEYRKRHLVQDGDPLPVPSFDGIPRHGRYSFLALARDQAGNTAFSASVPYWRDPTCFGRAARVELGPNDVQGTNGDDVLFVEDERGYGAAIHGLAGDDLLCATGGHNTLDGGPGYDRCRGGPYENDYVSCEVIVDP